MVEKYFTGDMLGINVNLLGEWLEEYYYFLDFYTRDQMPLMINTQYMTKAQFHEEEGRGGYFAPESGTSESQFLTIRGFLEVYKVTKDLKWLNKAVEMADASLDILYRGRPVPDQYDEDNLWLPHWLYNATDAFTAEKFYLDRKVSFVNGTGTFKTEFEPRKVYTARATDATLEWRNPFSDILGREYEIVSSEKNVKDYTLTVKLKENFTGDLLITYADLGGEKIERNEPYEAWPIWRKLKETEIACAIDALFWGYDCFKMLYEFTQDPKWGKALDNLKQTIPYAVNVVNAGDYLSQDNHTTDPLSSPASYVYQERDSEATLSRNSAGSIVIDVPYGEGFTQIGKGDLETEVTTDRKISLNIKTSRTNVIDLILQTTEEYSEEDRYTARFRLKKSNDPTVITFDREEFIQTQGILWDVFYKGGSRWETYSSYMSKVTATVIDEGKRDSLRVVSSRATETNEEGYAYLGWSQFSPVFEGSDNLSSIPEFRYKSKGTVNVRLTDGNDNYWTTPLPESEDYRNLSLSIDNFTSDTASSFVFPIKEIVFDTVSDTSTMYFQYLGQISSIPLGETIRQAVLNISSSEDQKLELLYMRPLPAEEYTYVPYVAPFTVNILGEQIDGWRGSAYTGYQAPWIWQELDDPKGLDVVLGFMERAQLEYEENTGVSGFFMPVFLWDRWDSREFGEPNSFAWEGPDPNTFWGGFQYRGIETVCRTWYNDPSNDTARRIVMRFMRSIDFYWESGEEFIITTFAKDELPIGEYDEPHMAALLLRGAVFAFQASNDDKEREILLSIIKKSVTYLSRMFRNFDNNTDWNGGFLNGTWTVDYFSWYNFWGGEILSAIALLLKYSKTTFNMQTAYGVVEVETYPDVDGSIENYLKVKTPIGVQRIELVDEMDENSTPFLVMTDQGKKAIGGVKRMDRNVRLLVKNQGNAMKHVTSIDSELILSGIEDGILRVNSIKGVTTENLSPVRAYDYSLNNWNNQFTVEPNSDYMLRFDISRPADTAITIVFRDESGADFGWRDVATTDTEKAVYFTFKTDPNARSMMMYLQEDGANVEVSDIMLLKGSYKDRPTPTYFTGTRHSAEVVNGRSFEIKVEKDGKVASLNLADIVPVEKLPLRSNGDVADEIVDNILYKRIGEDGSVLSNPETIVLRKSISVIESFKDARITFNEPNYAFPAVNMQYPVSLDSYLAEFVSE